MLSDITKKEEDKKMTDKQSMGIKKKRKENTNKCGICLEELKAPIAVIECGHIFHEECEEEWYFRAGTCAMCRCETKAIPFWPCEKCSATIVNLPFKKLKSAMTLIKEKNEEEHMCILH